MIHQAPEPMYDDGAARLYHGDLLAVVPHLSGIGAVITDPPYSSGGAFRSDRAQRTIAKYVNTSTRAHRDDFTGDNRDQRSFLAWSTLWLTACRHACDTGALLAVFTDWRQLPVMTDAVQAAGWLWRGLCTWTKSGYGRPHPSVKA